MKKIFLITLMALGAYTAEAQIKFGIKAGPNFADLDGKINSKMRVGFHAGAVLELKFNNFAIQPELMYSMQGAKLDFAKVDDINFSYVTVPVMAKYYILTDTFSIDAGPQFSFLVDDNIGDSTVSALKSESFDFAIAGGATLNITKSIFVSGRYVIGLTDASTGADIKNRVIQASVGLMF